MDTITVPTVLEIYRISYLVSKGWTYSEYANRWQKTGHSHKIDAYDYKTYEYKQVMTEEFELEAAYWEQVRSESKT